MYVYCVALLVIAAASNSETAWDIYRIQTVNGGSDTNRQINFYYPRNDVGNTRKGFNDFFNYDDFNRDSQSYDDFSNEWSRNSELVRTERQQLFPQNPVQTASDINVCIRNCPTTSEYNPVCGTNGVTYTNPSRLECAKFCGVVKQYNTADMNLCIRNCPTTSEYNPVCGTNGVTYTNPSRLECAKFCGVAVQLSRYSRCPEPGLSSTDSPTPPPSIATITPVRPTPVNPTPARPTPVTPSPAPPSPVTNPTTQSTTPSGLDFTVPQDILDSIFTTNYGTLIDERHED